MDETTKDLDNKCPDCGTGLYAYYHEAVSGDECTGTWNVECDKCDYKPENNCFATIESVGECFNVL